MAASVHQLLDPIVFTEIVSRIAGSQNRLLMHFGMNSGGTNSRYVGHARKGSAEIWNNNRAVGAVRTPGTAAGTRARSPVGDFDWTYPRMHERMSLPAEFMDNLAKIGDPGLRDAAGETRIQLEAARLAQVAANFRAVLLTGMIRDSLYTHRSGDDRVLNYTEASGRQLSFQRDGGNKDQLNMTDRGGTSIFGASIIDTPWTNNAADIPDQFAKINQARENQGVGPIRIVILDSRMWQRFIGNDSIASQAGIANSPFETFVRVLGQRPDGTDIAEHMGRVAALPNVEFIITDEGVELDDGAGTLTFTKSIGDNEVAMLGDINDGSLLMYEGSEMIAEVDGGEKTRKIGMQSWSRETADPTETQLFILDNALAVDTGVKNIIYATVTGF